jgi:hypothetical protein
VFQYAISHSEGFPLGTVAFVCRAAVGNIFLFWVLSGLYFLQNWTYVLVHLLSSQSSWIPAGCGYSHNSLYLLDICLCLDFVGVHTLFSVWSSQKGISIVVFLASMVLGSELIFLQVVISLGGLSLDVLKTHEPGYFRMFYCVKIVIVIL